MRGFLASVRGICLFRNGPEDLPYSRSLLVGLLAACGLLQAGFDLHYGVGGRAVAAALTGGLAAIGVVFLLLRGRGKRERFVQTATGLAAAYVLFDVVMFALMLLLPVRKMLDHPTRPFALATGQAWAALAVVLLAVWQLCVWVGVLRRALEISVVGGILVLLLLVLVDFIVMTLIAGLIGAA